MANRIFLAAPSATPEPPAPVISRTGLAGMRWEAWDGTTWDLLDPSGAFLKEGVRGLAMPPITRQTSDSPRGTRHRGHYVGERSVFWPLFLYADGTSQAWVDFDRQWWRGMRPNRLGRWVVTQPDGTERSIQLRYDGGGDQAFEADPSRQGWALYGVDLVAEQPMWQGTPIVRSWKNQDPVPFFGADGKLHIASGSTTGSARVSNDGDVEAWPVWTITGPTNGVTSVGVDGHLVEVPFELADGEVLRIDTDPEVQTAVMEDGTDRTDDLGAVDFAPIPDTDQPVRLDISLVGAGSVAASVTPLYYRAW
jgi:hypothetical protein